MKTNKDKCFRQWEIFWKIIGTIISIYILKLVADFFLYITDIRIESHIPGNIVQTGFEIIIPYTHNLIIGIFSSIIILIFSLAFVWFLIIYCILDEKNKEGEKEK